MKFELGFVLDSGAKFELDVPSVITGRTFIASITRWGKSWTARKILEECFGHAGMIIIDPEGEYASLREKYAFLIIGKDIPLQVETAEFMADKILESKVSVIIDTSATEEEVGKEYVDKFLRRFFFIETTARIPYLVVVEEAEDFVPEKGVGTQTCVGILRNITKKGGKRGIGILLIAHRPAWVSKGVLSQCSNKAIGKIEWPADLNVLEEYARIPHKTIEQLPTLNKGEFYLVGDWVEQGTFVKVGQVKTTHLGFTPDVIPPSPKELQAVISSLQRSLPELIEKIKPTVIPIEKMKSEMRAELDLKYKDRIEAVQRTSEEKAERKFKTKIDELQQHIETLSRSQALQPTSPISDVLEHPIVKTRMLELPDKTKDLLIKIEREPGLTREQLAAFLTTSTTSIAYMVDRVNTVFKATAIIGEGKPLRYRSLLKRLFITDVGKREIEELQRLKGALDEKSRAVQTLEPQVTELRREASSLRSNLSDAMKEIRELQPKLGRLTSERDQLEQKNKELLIAGKAGEALHSAISFIVDNKLKAFTPTNSNPQVNMVDEQKISEIVEQKISEKLASLPTQNNASQTNREELIQEIMTRIPKGVGNVVYEVAPLEKIQKDFLETAKNKILSDVSALSDEEKKTLRYVESVGKDVSNTELITKCFYLAMGGSSATKISVMTTKLKNLELLEKSAGGRNSPRLRRRIKELLEVHGATDQEVNQVYNHILMGILK